MIRVSVDVCVYHLFVHWVHIIIKSYKVTSRNTHALEWLWLWLELVSCYGQITVRVSLGLY